MSLRPSLLLLTLLAAQTAHPCVNVGHPEHARMLAEQNLIDFFKDLKIPEIPVDSVLHLLPPRTADLETPKPPLPQLADELRSFIHLDHQHTLEEPAPTFDKAYWQAQLKSLAPSIKAKHPKFEHTNLYASALVFTGKPKQAIKVLLQQEKLHPNRYETATNLGAAYELSGDIPQATRWIARGLQLNPESHHGTEWLHLAILNAKAATKKDRRWLETNGILDQELDLAQPASRQRAKHALVIQLSERLQFIKADDPFVADLFYTLGSIYDAENRPQDAQPFYDRSLEFHTLRRDSIASAQAATQLKAEHNELVTLAGEILTELLLSSASVPEEECCRFLLSYANFLTANRHNPDLSHNDLTYLHPDFWKAAVQMNLGNLLIPAIAASLHVERGELDKARRLVQPLQPIANSKAFLDNQGAQAIQLLDTSLNAFFTRAEARIQQGVALHDQGNYDQARLVYQQVLAAFPQSVWANWELQLSSGFAEAALDKDKMKALAPVLQRIQNLDPLFMIGGTFSRGPEMYRLLLRMSLRELATKPASITERYLAIAEASLLLEEFGYAAILYWQGAVLEQNTIAHEDLLARFLYCVAQLGELNLRSSFSETIQNKEAEVAAFVAEHYRASPAYK